MFDGLKDRARQAAAGAVIKQAGKAEGLAGAEGELDDIKQAASQTGADGIMADNRAQVGGSAGSAVNLVVALVVAGLMAAFLLPIAIDEIAAVDTTAWDGGAAALWDILPVMVVLAIFLFFVSLALSRQ